MPAHVPAWKRLGLKLKFAKEEPYEAIGHRNEHVNNVNDKKRKVAKANIDHATETEATKEPRKKQKTKSKKDNRTVIPEDEDYSPVQSKEKSSEPSPAQVTPKASRKSVSFTPETKTEDGEGVKQLYKTWVEKQTALDSSFDPSTVSPALRPVLPPTAATDESAATLKLPSDAKLRPNSDASPKKPKKAKKEKTKEEFKSSNLTSTTTHPALTYLTTYHTSPTTWKFSKPHQNHLLKHLFSLTHIPPSYDSALLSYLRGLQGSARSRIRQQALAKRSEDDEWLSSAISENETMDQETDAECKARRKRDYNAAVVRIKQQLRDKEDEREEREWDMLGDKEDWERHVRKRRRAELVLWSVGEKEEEEEVVKEPVAVPKPPVPTSGRQSGHEPVTIQSRGMGGVEQISVSGIAKGSAGKKTIFGEDKTNGVKITPGQHAVNGNEKGKNKSKSNINGTKRKRRRPRNAKERTDVPDDESSSDESSNSEESAVEERGAPKAKIYQRPVNWFEEDSSDESSSSGSGSGGSNDDSDSG